MVDVATFSTDAILADERPKVVSEVVSGFLAKMDISEPNGKPLEAKIDSVALKNTVLASFDLGPVLFERNHEMIKDGDDRFSLVACVGGAYDITAPHGETVHVFAGMAGLMSHRLPNRTLALGNSQEKTLVFPRELISHALRNPDERIGAVPEGGLAAIRLMASYMSGLLNEKKPILPKMQQLIEGHVLDLVANAYDPGGEWSRAAPNNGVHAARLQQILRQISESFAEQDLNAERIATTNGMSPRSVHQLLVETGQTLSEHILEQRLQAARNALQSERLLNKRVSEIALDVGFSDVSYFNRCFRRRFGDSPKGFKPVSTSSAQ